MNRRESKFGTLFRHYIKAHAEQFESCTFELKQTTTYSIPFSHIESHQENYSKAIMFGEKGVLIRVQGTNGEPDYNFYRKAPAYIVIKFPEWFCGITIFNLLAEKEISKKKSLSRARAMEIASFIQGC